MKSVIDKITGKFLYCRLDDPTEPNEIAIGQICDIEPQEGKEIYFDFEKRIFYLK
jgi:hypothetical protein